MAQISEGSARIMIPDWAGGAGPEKGPASSKMPVFYNPAMALGRDLCTLAVGRTGLSRPMKAVDGLAGSGVRAIRLAKETGIEFERLVANDRNRRSYELIMENVRQNRLEGKVEASATDLAALLSMERFDYIDIDPFGSPVAFIPAAMRAIRHGGMLGITATDTGPLCGTNPSTCMRRYGAVSMRSEYMHETAARILIGFCVRSAAAQDIGLTPVLTQADEHYIRVYLHAERSIKGADGALSRMGYAASDRRLMPMDEGSPKRGSVAGPMWLGPLFDAEALEGMWHDLGERVSRMALDPGAPAAFAAPARVSRMLELMRAEAGMPPLFYELDTVACLVASNPPRMLVLLEALRSAGFRASRTHFCPTGFCTDAPRDEMERLFRGAATGRTATVAIP